MPDRPLPVYWSRIVRNFGDELARVLVAWMSGADPVWTSPRQAGKVLAVGSNHRFVLPGDVVWGTGAIRDVRVDVSQASVLAVRGPLTRRLMDGDVPEVYGDPAILLPRLYPKSVATRWRLGVVPHYVDQQAVAISDPAVRVIDVLRPWRQVVDEITSCEQVVSSSLHGLIVAEAYGIPAGWMTVTAQVIGAERKFHDYLLGSGRDPVEPVRYGDGPGSLDGTVLPAPTFDPDSLVAAWQSQNG